MKPQLFEIVNYDYNTDGYIVIEITKNAYTDDTTIVIAEDKFEKWLDLDDRLTFEDMRLNVNMDPNTFKITLRQYFDWTDHKIIEEDLHDFIAIRHIDFDRAMARTQQLFDAITRTFKIT